MGHCALEEPECGRAHRWGGMQAVHRPRWGLGAEAEFLRTQQKQPAPTCCLKRHSGTAALQGKNGAQELRGPPWDELGEPESGGMSGIQPFPSLEPGSGLASHFLGNFQMDQ